MKNARLRFCGFAALTTVSVLGVASLSVSLLGPGYFAFGQDASISCADMVFGSTRYSNSDTMSASVYTLHGISGTLDSSSKCYGASGSSLRLGSSSAVRVVHL
jgi:hypothetical protein